METKKRENWDAEETRYFLQLMRDRQIMKSLNGKRFRADVIFKYLESPMNEKGCNKTSKQMQTRFRTLRLQYNKIRRQMGKSGAGNCMSSFPYTEEMGQFLDFRPIAIGVVIDSTPLQDFSKNDDNSYSSNSIYENEPDPRDGAIPGCSSASDSSLTSSMLQEESSSDSNIVNQSTIKESSRDLNTVNRSTINSAIPAKKRKVSRSNEAVILRYADKLKENYEEAQSKIMKENRNFVKSLVESEKQLEKEIINNMLESQRSILKETTNQLLIGLQNIFSPSQQSTVSVPTINPIAQSPFVMSPVHYSPFSPSNLDSRVFHSSSPFPKVLVNLKKPVSTQITAANVQQTIPIEKSPEAKDSDLI